MTTYTMTTDQYNLFFESGLQDGEFDLDNGTYWLPEWVDPDDPADRAYADGYLSLKDEAADRNYLSTADDDMSAAEAAQVRGWEY